MLWTKSENIRYNKPYEGQIYPSIFFIESFLKGDRVAMKTNRILTILAILSVIMVGAWAMENQNEIAQVETTDFDPNNASDYPVLTDIRLDIKGIASYGKIYMLEGIENTSSVEFSERNGYSAGRTTYPRLILHGVFNKIMRDWRNAIISGKTETHDIQLDLVNKAGKRVLRIMFYGAMPIKFSLPPLSIENNTRYMERMEFVYTYFDITN